MSTFQEEILTHFRDLMRNIHMHRPNISENEGDFLYAYQRYVATWSLYLMCSFQEMHHVVRSLLSLPSLSAQVEVFRATKDTVTKAQLLNCICANEESKTTPVCTVSSFKDMQSVQSMATFMKSAVVVLNAMKSLLQLFVRTHTHIYG
jgi:hypothetical protein